MKSQFEEKATNGMFILHIREGELHGDGILDKKNPTMNTIVFNNGPEQHVKIDAADHLFPAFSVLPLVANQHFTFQHPAQLIAWQFNRDFYCIAEHDAEVGCVGFLFYGIQHPLFVHLPLEEQVHLQVLQRLCLDDMIVQDQMQGEMLRTLLKRLIIQITRLAKKQTKNYTQFTAEKMNIVRQFNLLLETHFRRQHEVRFYADAMNKSPKTLTNIFGQCQYPAPSKLIQQRIVSEAKRYLLFTKKSAKEIADELGFTSMAHFSRFFKQHAGINFSDIKALQKETASKA